MTSESVFRIYLQKHYFRSFTSEALLQKHTSEASLQKHYFRSFTSEAHVRSITSEALFRSTLQLLITILMVVQKGVHKQTQNHQEHEEHASTHDINKSPVKYNQGIKAFICLKSKRASSMFIQDYEHLKYKTLRIFH